VQLEAGLRGQRTRVADRRRRGRTRVGGAGTAACGRRRDRGRVGGGRGRVGGGAAGYTDPSPLFARSWPRCCLPCPPPA